MNAATDGVCLGQAEVVFAHGLVADCVCVLSQEKWSETTACTQTAAATQMMKSVPHKDKRIFFEGRSDIFQLLENTSKHIPPGKQALKIKISSHCMSDKDIFRGYLN